MRRRLCWRRSRPASSTWKRPAPRRARSHPVTTAWALRSATARSARSRSCTIDCSPGSTRRAAACKRATWSSWCPTWPSSRRTWMPCSAAFRPVMRATFRMRWPTARRAISRWRAPSNNCCGCRSRASRWPKAWRCSRWTPCARAWGWTPPRPRNWSPGCRTRACAGPSMRRTAPAWAWPRPRAMRGRTGISTPGASVCRACCSATPPAPTPGTNCGRACCPIPASAACRPVRWARWPTGWTRWTAPAHNSPKPGDPPNGRPCSRRCARASSRRRTRPRSACLRAWWSRWTPGRRTAPARALTRPWPWQWCANTGSRASRRRASGSVFSAAACSSPR